VGSYGVSTFGWWLLLTASRRENETAGNEADRIGTTRNEPAAQTAKALVDRQVRFPAAPQEGAQVRDAISSLGLSDSTQPAGDC
jgi:hypothetical protein